MKNKIAKRVFNLYNIIVLACIIVIGISLYIIFKPKTTVTPYGVEIVNTNTKETEEITEEKARKVAVKQFKKLGETDLKAQDLDVLKIERDSEEYYYICSLENTMEIKIKGGQITRINSASVEV
jgi:uncharacterized protein YxeA